MNDYDFHSSYKPYTNNSNKLNQHLIPFIFISISLSFFSSINTDIKSITKDKTVEKLYI